MAPAAPYQPALLRLLHAGIALFALTALITGYWVYDQFDHRFGEIGLPELFDIQGIHGTLGLAFLLWLPGFTLYSLRLGHRRLLQPQSLQQLQHWTQPQATIALHRLANTLLLLSGTAAVITGRMMKEAWLPAGDLQQPWYIAHLVTWLLLFLSIAFHVLMGAKVGGAPLLLSMFRLSIHDNDSPPTWLQKFPPQPVNSLLLGLEILTFGGIGLSFILPLF
ncbi:MAG: cytochrome b/b6 domain-containing protein [Prochlorothrix sp.]